MIPYVLISNYGHISKSEPARGASRLGVSNLSALALDLGWRPGIHASEAANARCLTKLDSEGDVSLQARVHGLVAHRHLRGAFGTFNGR